MANAIELVSKHIPMLDYAYKVGSKTSVLDAQPALVQNTLDAKEIKIPKLHLTGLKDYSRNDGFKMGSATLTWETHTFTQDRSSRFNIDFFDNIESLGDLYENVALQNQKEQVIPELDAYRFSTYATKAENKSTVAPSKANVVTLLADAQTALDEAEVPEEGRYLFVSNQFYNYMKTSSEIQKKISVETRQDSKGLDFNIETFDNMPIIRVPQVRFKTAYVFNPDGGFSPDIDAKDINFMIIHPSAVMQIMKRAVTRVFAPTPELASQIGAWGVAQNMDGWDIQDRLYHDAFVLGNKTEGIYVNHNA